MRTAYNRVLLVIGVVGFAACGNDESGSHDGSTCTADAGCDAGQICVADECRAGVRPELLAVSPQDGAVIGVHSQIVLRFSHAMSSDSLVLHGGLAEAADPQFSESLGPNDTLTLSAAAGWPSGTQDLIVDAVTVDGAPLLTIQLSYDVDGTPPAPTQVLPLGDRLAETTAVVVAFGESMNPDMLSLGGDLGAVAQGRWASVDAANDTLTIAPTSVWPSGSHDLTVEGEDVSGNAMPLFTLTFDVDNVAPRGTFSVADGAAISPLQPIVISFTESVDPESLVLGGELAADVDRIVWSHSTSINDTVTLYPPPEGWSGSSGGLSLTASDVAGVSMLPASVLVSIVYSLMEEWIVVPMRAYRVADDDGGRAAHITAAQVATWVQRANQIYAVAKIYIDYDPATDFASTNQTLINQMGGDSDAQWIAERDAANAVAAEHPNEMTVLFRWGPGDSPSGGGFSWTSYNFVIMPGFNDTGLCGHQNIDILAHEVGHYLGLRHTFTEHATVAAAESALTAAGNNPSVFEGDGLVENGVDPFIRAIDCSGGVGVTLNGTPFTLGRTDIMSYYDNTEKTLSPPQIQIARQVAISRTGQPLSNLIDDPDLMVFEGEDLPVSGDGSYSDQTNMAAFHGKWSGGAQLFWSAAVGDTLGAELDPGQAGLYRIFITVTRAPDFGIHEVAINGVGVMTLDLYGGEVLHQGPIDLGVHWLPATGSEMSFTVIGRRPASTGWSLGLDYVMLQPQP